MDCPLSNTAFGEVFRPSASVRHEVMGGERERGTHTKDDFIHNQYSLKKFVDGAVMSNYLLNGRIPEWLVVSTELNATGKHDKIGQSLDSVVVLQTK